MSLADDLKKFDFQALDWKNVGSFPLAVRAVLLFIVFVVMAGVVYWFFIKDSLSAWDRAKAEETSLRQVFADKANKATNLEAYKAQLQQMDRQFGEPAAPAAGQDRDREPGRGDRP